MVLLVEVCVMVVMKLVPVVEVCVLVVEKLFLVAGELVLWLVR